MAASSTGGIFSCTRFRSASGASIAFWICTPSLAAPLAVSGEAQPARRSAVAAARRVFAGEMFMAAAYQCSTGAWLPTRERQRSRPIA